MMNLAKARDFWKTVVDNGAMLCALQRTPPMGAELQATIERIGKILQMLREAAADINPLLSIEVDQVPSGNAAELRLAVTCHHDPQGIEAVQQLVAMAPGMPSGVKVYAFSPPVPREMLRGLGSLEFPGHTILVHQVLFTAEPSPLAPGAFDVVCFVPGAAVTEMDVEGLPGALVAHIMLSMGIGELRVMTRVRSIGVAITEQAPAQAVPAWDLIEVFERAPVH